MTRRLDDMVVDLLQAVQAPPGTGLRTSQVRVDLPVEVRTVAGEDGLRVDVPAWRWVTWFDRPPSRLAFRCVLEPAGEP